MRILYVQDSLGSGGAERSNAELWYYLKKNHNILKIVVLKHRKHGVEKEILEMGFDVVFLSPGSYLSQVKELAGIIKEYSPELVHSVLFKSNIRVRGAKLFASFFHLESLVNCTYDSSRLNDPHVNKWKLEAYRYYDFITQLYGVDHYHANGQTVAQHYREKLYIGKERISIVPRGRKENKFVKNEQSRKIIREELGTENRIQLITVGRMEFQKGQEIIIEAMGKLKAANVTLLIVGRDGENNKLIEQKIKQYNLGEVVKLLGHRQDVYQLLAASDIFVFPSRFEGLPGALIEAEAAGLSIVCSSIPNNTEVVEPNKNALVFKTDNVDELAGHLEYLIEKPQKRKEMGAESLKIFKGNFTIEQVHEQMFDLYTKLIEAQK